MPHPLEDEYNLTAEELLDMINERFRLKVALAGAVAEVQCEKRLIILRESGVISLYEQHDVDDYPDFTIFPSEEGPELKVEVKNVRNYKAGYREGGEIVAYMVELQKTRRGADESSRFYDIDRFDVVAVCLGKKTGNYEDFLFARAADLRRHDKFPDKLAAIHRLPIPGIHPEHSAEAVSNSWYESLEDLLTVMRGVGNG